MELEPEVAWKKWRDPFGADIEKHEISLPDIENEEEIPYENRISDEDRVSHVENLLPKRPMRFVQTQIGFIPLTEDTEPGKVFNFWVGHTNFTITENIYKAIEQVEGVEVAVPLSRYRFQIGIGQLFKDRDVMNVVRTVMINTHKSSYVKQKLSELQKMAETKLSGEEKNPNNKG